MTSDLEGIMDAALAFLRQIDDAVDERNERKRRASLSRRAATWGISVGLS